MNAANSRPMPSSAGDGVAERRRVRGPRGRTRAGRSPAARAGRRATWMAARISPPSRMFGLVSQENMRRVPRSGVRIGLLLIRGRRPGGSAGRGCRDGNGVRSGRGNGQSDQARRKCRPGWSSTTELDPLHPQFQHPHHRRRPVVEGVLGVELGGTARRRRSGPGGGRSPSARVTTTPSGSSSDGSARHRQAVDLAVPGLGSCRNCSTAGRRLDPADLRRRPARSARAAAVATARPRRPSGLLVAGPGRTAPRTAARRCSATRSAGGRASGPRTGPGRSAASAARRP